MTAAPNTNTPDGDARPVTGSEDSPLRRVLRQLLADRGVVIGGGFLLLVTALAALAPFLGTMDPALIEPAARNAAPGTQATLTGPDGVRFDWIYRLGSDTLGRDLYSRLIYGARTSLVVGFTVAALGLAIGMAVGLVAGYFRSLDGVIMRVMDGLMAIPGILLAIALVSLRGASLWTVIVAITIPEIPRVSRLVRALVLGLREEPFVEAAISVGTTTPRLLLRHILPNTLGPLIVQGTYIVASAILVEAALGFLGAGIPPEIPTWGNIMAESRTLFRIHPYGIFFPGLFLAVTVLAVNLVGDGLRDTLDPKSVKRN